MNELDEARIKRIMRALMEAVLANYEMGPPSSERVLEALNALAVTAAYVLVGARSDQARQDAYEFFLNALAVNMDGAVEHAAEYHPAGNA